MNADVERVAQAVAGADHIAAQAADGDTWDSRPECHDEWRDMARAAMAAMQEPTVLGGCIECKSEREHCHVEHIAAMNQSVSVTTVKELEALPDESVVVASDDSLDEYCPLVFIRERDARHESGRTGGWWMAGSDLPLKSRDIYLPATVLYPHPEPDVEVVVCRSYDGHVGRVLGWERDRPRIVVQWRGNGTISILNPGALQGHDDVARDFLRDRAAGIQVRS